MVSLFIKISDINVVVYQDSSLLVRWHHVCGKWTLDCTAMCRIQYDTKKISDSPFGTLYLSNIRDKRLIPILCLCFLCKYCVRRTDLLPTFFQMCERMNISAINYEWADGEGYEVRKCPMRMRLLTRSLRYYLPLWVFSVRAPKMWVKYFFCDPPIYSSVNEIYTVYLKSISRKRRGIVNEELYIRSCSIVDKVEYFFPPS